MSRVRSNRPCRIETRDIEVYCILFPETNQVFIGKNLAPNHYQSYKDHVRGRKPLTKNLFEIARQTGNFPKMYLLNRLQSTETRAYRYIVAWTKFFVDKGFQVLGHTKTLDYATDLVEETQKIFDEIKDFSLEDITNEEKILVGNYAQKTTDPEKIPNRITITVTPEEYKLIQQKAGWKNMSIPKYCKHNAIYGGVLRINIDACMELLESMHAMLYEIVMYCYAYERFPFSYYKNLFAMREQVHELEKKIRRDLNREFKKLIEIRNGK